MNYCKTSALDTITFTRGIKNGLNAFIADKLEDSKTAICRPNTTKYMGILQRRRTVQGSMPQFHAIVVHDNVSL